MSHAMTYKGYAARVEYSSEDGCLIGHVAGIGDIVGFHGESVGELRRAFEAAVDDYLATCEKLGKEPETPYTGTLTLHLPPDTHASVALAAAGRGQSVDQWVAEVLNRALVTP